MTYASDRGLTVGSKIKTLEGSDYYGDGEVLTLVEDDNHTWPLFTSEFDLEPHPFILTRKWEHYKDPKLVWKEMTLEEVKAVQLGDKIRINGDETTVVFIYDKFSDFGFEISSAVSCHKGKIISTGFVLNMGYKFEKLVEEAEMNNSLERDKEYHVKLTGDDIAHIFLLTGYAYNMHSLYNKVANLLGTKGGVVGVKLPPVNLFAEVGYEDAMNKLLAKTPETEDQRKLRELKEQYAELGKAIEAMENK